MESALKNRFWFWTLLWTAGIYASIPIGRPLCEAVRRMNLLNFSVNMVIVSVLIGFIVWLLLQKKIAALQLGLFVLVAGIVLFSLNALDIPEEKIHFIQYGPLAYLAFRALKENFATKRAYLFAFLLAACLGYIDEGIQSLTPGRFFGWRDVLLNSIGAGVGLLLTFIGDYRKEKNL